MSPITVAITIIAYFILLFTVSWLAGRKTDNQGFFLGGRKQPWFLVAIATMGSFLSGVTFVSVPGMVADKSFSYLQMVMGFVVGQFIIAFVLVPLFYKMNLVSVYQYLEDRFGARSHKTGAWFFFISKMLGASVRLFLVCLTVPSAFSAECAGHGSPCLGIYLSRGRAVGYLDRRAQVALPNPLGDALHRLHIIRTKTWLQGNAPVNIQQQHEPGVLLR